MKVTEQTDLFAPTPTQEDLDSFVGTEHDYQYDLGKPLYVKYLTAPRWNEAKQRWQCLASVEGMMCVVEVYINVEETA